MISPLAQCIEDHYHQRDADQQLAIRYLGGGHKFG